MGDTEKKIAADKAEAPDETIDEKTGQKRLLSTKQVRKAYWDWMFWNLSVQNMERMQGPAIVKMLGGVKETLYPGDREKQKALLERHEPFFNTEPYVGSIVPGVVLGMEEENARAAGSVPEDMINGVKTALMGPFAGIGDSLYVGTLIPILLSIGLGFSSDSGSAIGPVFYIIANLAIMLTLTWWLFNSGYNMGINATQKVLANGMKDKITKAMTIIGLVVVGAITASYVNVQCGLVFTQGEMSININDTLTKLFPHIVTLALGLMSYFLISRKKLSMGWLFLIFLLIAIVGYFTGIVVLPAA